MRLRDFEFPENTAPQEYRHYEDRSLARFRRPRRGVNLPCGDEHCRNQRPDDETVNAENRNAAESGD